jgi:pyruvate carboxylase
MFPYNFVCVQVFEDYATHRNLYGDVSILDTPTFVEGMAVSSLRDIEYLTFGNKWVLDCNAD